MNMFPIIKNIPKQLLSNTNYTTKDRPKSANSALPKISPGTHFGALTLTREQLQKKENCTHHDDLMLTPNTTKHRRPHFVQQLNTINALPNETLPASIEIAIQNLFKLTAKAYDKEGYAVDKQEFESADTAKYSSLNIQKWVTDAFRITNEVDFKAKAQELLLDPFVTRVCKRESSGRSYNIRTSVLNPCINEFNGLVLTLLETAVFSKKGTQDYFEKLSNIPTTQEACEEHITELFKNR